VSRDEVGPASAHTRKWGCGFPAATVGEPPDDFAAGGNEIVGMQRSYGVVWREGGRPVVAGKLELLPRSLRLEGRQRTRDIPYETLAGFHVGRSPAERLDGRPAVVLERRGGEVVTIATVAQSSLVGEIAERLAGLQLGAKDPRPLAVVVPLAPGALEAVRALLDTGPPFEPEAIEGLDRHEVFLTETEAVFVFESSLGTDALAALLTDPQVWQTAGAWREHVAGPPRIAESVFSWSRAEPAGAL
jgi:hypothetical protein